MRFWATGPGLRGRGVPGLMVRLLTYKLLLTYQKERNPGPWSQNTSLSTSDPRPLLGQGPTLDWSEEAGAGLARGPTEDEHIGESGLNPFLTHIMSGRRKDW